MKDLRILPVVGRRNREWQIVNEHGGLVELFEGGAREAAARCCQLETESMTNDELLAAFEGAAERGHDTALDRCRAELAKRLAK